MYQTSSKLLVVATGLLFSSISVSETFVSTQAIDLGLGTDRIYQGDATASSPKAFVAFGALVMPEDLVTMGNQPLTYGAHQDRSEGAIIPLDASGNTSMFQTLDTFFAVQGAVAVDADGRLFSSQSFDQATVNRIDSVNGSLISTSLPDKDYTVMVDADSGARYQAGSPSIMSPGNGIHVEVDHHGDLILTVVNPDGTKRHFHIIRDGADLP